MLENILSDDCVPVNELVVVMDGRGIKSFEQSSRFAEWLVSLQERGVTFRATEETMEAYHLTPDELIPGVEVIPSISSELARLQSVGCGYVKL